jgi:hypothetical protein
MARKHIVPLSTSKTISVCAMTRAPPLLPPPLESIARRIFLTPCPKSVPMSGFFAIRPSVALNHPLENDNAYAAF